MNEAGLNAPVFIVGVPRSGTSMLWSLLCQHEVFRGQEGTAGWDAETSLFDGFAKLLDDLFQPATPWGGHVLGNAMWYEYFAGDRGAFDAWVDDALRGFLLRATKARGARRVLEKTPDHLKNLARIGRALPDAQVIVMVRHPLDVFASYRKRLFVTPPAMSGWLAIPAVEFGKTYEKSLCDALSEANKLSTLHVRYEDLTGAPRETLERISAFLGIRADLSLLDGPTPERARRPFPYKSHVPVKNSQVWENALSNAEVETILRETTRTRALYGYDVTTEESCARR